jgi:hypothetical protein
MSKKPKPKAARKPKASRLHPVPFAEQLTPQQMSAIERHVEKHLGKFELVWHELVSEGVHIDLLPVEPSKKHRFKTIVTMGMSARPQAIPRGEQAPKRLELFIMLPPEWPTDQKAFRVKGDRHYWPLRGLKELARYPSLAQTYFDVGHTIPNGFDAKPFAPSCKFVCWLLLPPLMDEPLKFMALNAPRFKVNFLMVVPLYKEEMHLKLDQGLDALLDRFEKFELDVAVLFDPKRPNVAEPRRTPRR